MDEDIKLVECLKNRDEDSMVILYSRYRGFVYAIISKTALLSRDDINDLIEITMLKVWENIESYNPSRARFETWLAVVARNTTHDHGRAIRRQPRVASLDEESVADEAEAAHLRAYELRARVDSALAALSDDERVELEKLKHGIPQGKPSKLRETAKERFRSFWSRLG